MKIEPATLTLFSATRALFPATLALFRKTYVCRFFTRVFWVPRALFTSCTLFCFSTVACVCSTETPAQSTSRQPGGGGVGGQGIMSIAVGPGAGQASTEHQQGWGG